MMIQYDKDDVLLQLKMKSPTSHYFLYKKENGQHYKMWFDKDKDVLITECSKWCIDM